MSHVIAYPAPLTTPELPALFLTLEILDRAETIIDHSLVLLPDGEVDQDAYDERLYGCIEALIYGATNPEGVFKRRLVDGRSVWTCSP